MNRSSTALVLWRLWSGVGKESFRVHEPVATDDRHAGLTSGGGDGTRQWWSVFFLGVAFVGAIASAVCIPQAMYQARVERGVTGSYQVTGCVEAPNVRARLLGRWKCRGVFQAATAETHR